MLKYFSPGIIAMAICLSCYAQNAENKNILDSITALDTAHSLTSSQKLGELYYWKKRAEYLNVSRDSIYARILHKIGVYEFLVNKNYHTAIDYTLQAIQFNSLSKKSCARALIINSYYNLGYYFDKLTLFNEALNYYDSSLLIALHEPGSRNAIFDSRLGKAYIFFRKGDYQKSIEESTLGLTAAIANKDSLYYSRFLNQKAQSHFFQNQPEQALSDVNSAVLLAVNMHQSYQLASAYKMKGYIYAKNSAFADAEGLFQKSIDQRKLTNDYGQIAGDYNDFGNLYRDSLNNFIKAEKYYDQAILYAFKANDSVRLCRIQVNLGEIEIIRHDYDNASACYTKALRYLKVNARDNILLNPNAAMLNVIGNKELLLTLMRKKTELLLLSYKKNNNRNYLNACLQTALLTDSILTRSRHELLAEQSKLFWRKRTREFFNSALEACYLAGNPELAFYFMEKSRAVLLNDRLNELGASGQLPIDEAAKEQSLRITIVEEQQKLSVLQDSMPEYKSQQVKLFNAKENFEAYIKVLEKEHPAYYQYKYSEKVNTLQELQKYLALNKQSFVHYFMGDTVGYILSISGSTATTTRLSKKELPYIELSTFLLLCSDKQTLNHNYTLFASVSNRLYKNLFQLLHVQEGRVIICPDNFIIPFEALCTDTLGKNFLMENYSFSYVYSAGFLLKKFDTRTPKGNFIGFAPVTYSPYLNLPDLNQSAVSLRQCAAFYDNSLLLTNAKATKQNFIHLIPAYTIVNIFSHAMADTTGNEPVLFLQDSMLNVSELQMLNSPATQLVILSACQTNVGKNASGEGVYSLGRGFAAVGIPSVAGTLWKADEQSIYTISTFFHKYLSQGMSKDNALQKAKLDFVKINNNNDRRLPFYWSGMIIIGDTGPLNFSVNPTFSLSRGITAAMIFAGMLLAFFIWRKISIH